jgi:hypothetical protein
VQNGRDQGVAVQPQVRQDVCDRDWMSNVGFAGDAFLALVFFRAVIVGFAHALDLRGGEVGFELV